MFQFNGILFENYFVWVQDHCAFASQEINELSLTWIYYPADHCNRWGRYKAPMHFLTDQNPLWINSFFRLGFDFLIISVMLDCCVYFFELTCKF